MIRVDLHIHTKYSQDSSINPKTLVDQLFAHASVEAVAVTDHDTVEGYGKVRELATPFDDILIILGVEITTAEGDLLVLGVTPGVDGTDAHNVDELWNVCRDSSVVGFG